ncbi:hypothetical protein PC9H_007930 [Pleurotus ostreatus]|uniref:CBM1 domain-containing protein n=1 Tax=Pleurotus ostreatus TaxID=5322 RepID=A0A8H7DQM6_PLEOS|nr:uncharacterized protein PC9H_007930 [Pleurotus ostreatus]KAF7428701.1 hypothetical protein PC9H_007930 [Pleurotus ostreatus]
MLAPILFALLPAIVLNVAAQSPAWGQCGGIGWSGATTCVSGYACTVSNPYYSQCLPGTAPPASTTPTPTTPISTPSVPSSTTVSAPGVTGSQIRTVENPVFHFYLQNKGDVPMLGPESSSARFTIDTTITLNNADGSSLYLNLQNSTLSYKALTLSATATTTNWGLEGDTIITTDPRQLNFLACGSGNPLFYSVYLQTGTDTPIGWTCSSVTLHLP